ncbi:MAG: hypothetical protein PHR20_05745, partial [Bacteroidales bacterium]|nr:hypothetical protein [Bacteroidales bacterium]
EYLAANSDKELDSPIYATAIGLVKEGIEDAKGGESGDDDTTGTDGVSKKKWWEKIAEII